MIQKTPSPTVNQLKRTHHSSTPYEQQIDAQSSIEQLISRIQLTIIQTSESMKQQLSSFQQNELINYKNDLLKTQQEFIKIRAERNEDAIKTQMLKEKAQVEEKFNTQIRKSMDMNAKYEKMKALVKRMNQDQHQIMMEINYVKKKIDKETKEGLRFDEEIRELERKNDKKSSKRVSKMDQQRKLFTELVNKCEKEKNQNKNAEDDLRKPSVVESYQKKMENRLKYEISNLRDYIENIPLELNFVESMIQSSIKGKFSQIKIEEEDVESDENEQAEQQMNGEKGQQIEKSDDEKAENKETKQAIKLPTIANASLLDGKKLNMKNKSNKQNSHQPKSPTAKKRVKPFQSKVKVMEKQKQTKQSQEMPTIEQLPISSVLLEEVLSNREFKEYLYRMIFGGTNEE